MVPQKTGGTRMAPHEADIFHTKKDRLMAVPSKDQEVVVG